MKLRAAAGPAFLGAILLWLVGCEIGNTPEVVVGLDGCSSCGMVIPDEYQLAVFSVDKEHSPFCSTGCLLAAYESRRRCGDALPDSIFFADFLSSELIPSSEAVFVFTDREATVMDWGVLAFTAHGADAYRREGEVMVDWLGLRTRLGSVDRKLEVVVTPEGLKPSVIELDKGQLVEWSFRAEGLVEDVTLILRGYDELGEVVVPADGSTVTRRLLVIRPGDGFPLMRKGSDEVLGRLRVRGAHTADEGA